MNRRPALRRVKGRCQIGSHIVSTVSGIMVPSWFRGPCGEPARPGGQQIIFAHQPVRTRRNDVRGPAKRNRAQTLR
jgi:hypothetical protein